VSSRALTLMLVFFALILGTALDSTARGQEGSEPSSQRRVTTSVPDTAPPADAVCELDLILQEWECACEGRLRMDARFTRFKYDNTFEVERRATGTLAVDSAGRAVYRLAPATIAPGEQSKKTNRNGTPYTLKTDEADRWHWTGETVIRVDDKARAFEEMDLRQRCRDAEFIPEPPPLPEDALDDDADQSPGIVAQPVTPMPAPRVATSAESRPGLGEVLLGLIFSILFQPAISTESIAIGDSFQDAIREFPLARPFLLGMPVAELKQSFRIELLSQDDGEVRLQLTPKGPRQRVFYERAILMLKRDNYALLALKMRDITGAEMVHVFSDVSPRWGFRHFFRDTTQGSASLRPGLLNLAPFGALAGGAIGTLLCVGRGGQWCLRHNENVIAVGAQTERRGDAWPVRGLLGGKDLAGRFVLRLRNRSSTLTAAAGG
jgi:hypothetical protein